MYLSRLILNLRSREVRRDLGDVHELHRTVMSGFPETAGEDARRHHAVLFRLEDDRSPTPVLLVQSRTQPGWSALPTGYLEPQPDNPATKSLAALEQIQAGQVLRFRLTANPTRKIDTKTLVEGKRRHGRRVELRTEAEQVAWLKRRAQAAGFELMDPERTLLVKRCGRVIGRRGMTPIVAAPVQFDGLLRVTDPELLRSAMTAGIGPGKAYGMGLLSVGGS